MADKDVTVLEHLQKEEAIQDTRLENNSEENDSKEYLHECPCLADIHQEESPPRGPEAKQNKEMLEIARQDFFPFAGSDDQTPPESKVEDTKEPGVDPEVPKENPLSN
ncbi:hypothetical protein WMY93_024486 [Mugilogobius chulae]|uniref:Uncharacterized protein n=1 Tax=Mugilogobius chulae TaxID=88201 RepID=A0AAW0MZU0_9GOBI